MRYMRREKKEDVDCWDLLFYQMIDEKKPTESASNFIKCMKARFFNKDTNKNFSYEIQKRFCDMLQRDEYENVLEELNKLIPVQLTEEDAHELLVSGENLVYVE